MFFTLSKTLGYFALPSNFFLSIAVLGILLMWTRFARAGRSLASAGALLLLIAGFSPLGNMLTVPLEDRFPRWDASRGAPDGVVVLGGVINPGLSRVRREIALDEAAERITGTVELALRYPKMRIVFSGGSGELLGRRLAEATVAVIAFEKLGLPRERIELESRSRNTLENAVFSKQLIQPKPGERWLVVTSALHMPRAMAVFRAAGFPVEAYPVDWHTYGSRDLFRPFVTLADGLRRTDLAAREWMGLAVYRLTGKTAELFPALDQDTGASSGGPSR